MTSLANSGISHPVQYISDTAPENAKEGDWWWRTTADVSAEAIDLYILDDQGDWLQSGSLGLGTLAPPP